MSRVISWKCVLAKFINDLIQTYHTWWTSLIYRTWFYAMSRVISWKCVLAKFINDLIQTYHTWWTSLIYLALLYMLVWQRSDARGDCIPLLGSSELAALACWRCMIHPQHWWLQTWTLLLHAMTKALSWWALSFSFLFVLHNHWRSNFLTNCSESQLLV
jgi:hypothetical protein